VGPVSGIPAQKTAALDPASRTAFFFY